jgi:hypothetical protein
MVSAENSSRALTKCLHHAVRLEALQEHDSGSVLVRFLELLQNFKTRMRAILKLIADKRDVGFVRRESSNYVLGTSD